jgi:hypothetical protein
MFVNTTFDFKNYIAKSVDYATYSTTFETTIEQNTALPEADQVPYFKYYALNLQRTQRIHKQYHVTPALLAAIEALAEPIHWLVITEPWCGDSAQNLPIIASIAEASNGKIQLHILYRDENTELIDGFLTNGGRSIPKLLQLDENYEQQGNWGPRPAQVQELFLKLKADGLDHDAYAEIVHKWYADDKAQSLSNELVELLGKANQ